MDIHEEVLGGSAGPLSKKDWCRVFVYGTLKSGFYNHNAVMKPVDQVGSSKNSNGSAEFLFNGSTLEPYFLCIASTELSNHPYCHASTHSLKGLNDYLFHFFSYLFYTILAQRKQIIRLENSFRRGILGRFTYAKGKPFCFIRV